MYAALEVDYTDVDQDPTGEAFDTTEKVRANALNQIDQKPDQ